MINIISRAPGDDFTLNLFKSIVATMTATKFHAYYIWTNPPDLYNTWLRHQPFEEEIIFLGIKDTLDYWRPFDFWHDQMLIGFEKILNKVNRHPKQKFYIFTSYENVLTEIQQKPDNVEFISWGSDWTNQAAGYINLLPVVDKNFNSTTAYISLNRGYREHRLTLLSYLFGKGYHQTGNISSLYDKIENNDTAPNDWLYRISWEFSPEHEHNGVRDAILNGFPLFFDNPKYKSDPFDIYEQIGQANDNISNFNQSLRAKYQNSFVELVNETTYESRSFMITEKTLNSIYGCNLPILIGGSGIVAHLRELGFDMFDDIINHNYDLIQNPFDRMVTAVEDNVKLLTDVPYAKAKWLSAKERLLKNVEVAKTIYDFYTQRAITQFNLSRNES